MAKVEINPKILKWAIERSGRTMAEFSRKFEKINQWLEGTEQPTIKQLEMFAQAAYIPLGYLFLDTPLREKLPIPHFRTIKHEGRDNPSPDLMETLNMMQRRQDWLREFVIEEGREPPSWVKSVGIHDSPENAAAQMRKALGLDESWALREKSWSAAFNVLRKGMENAGILVVINGIVGNNTRRILDPGEFRGFVLIDDYVPLVFVNGTDGKAAQMFTLAHELAHVFMGVSAIFDLNGLMPADETQEKACDRIAAEFLVPRIQMNELWKPLADAKNRFQLLAKHFKVSEIVIARRSLDLNLITRREFQEFYLQYRTFERESRQSGGNFYLNQPFRIGGLLARAVVQAVREGKLLYTEAYKLTGLHGKTFEHFEKRQQPGGVLP